MTSPETSGSAIVGIDIGGTFTDVILNADGDVRVVKLLSTPGNYGDAILDGLSRVLALAPGPRTPLARIAHGTTVASNAVLENSAAAPALVTTAGFRDVIAIGRLRLATLYDVAIEKPRPLVPRELRFEVVERIGADGSVVIDLDEASTDAVIEAVRASGVTAVAISLLNAHANPAHERALRTRFAERLPDVDITLATDISRQVREVERTSTAVVNAYLRPVLRHYLGQLRARLDRAGVSAPLFVSRSTGGLTTADSAMDQPVTILESGPAAGVVAAAALAKAHHVPAMISFDMGGTTAKAASVEHGAFVRSPDFTVGGGILTGSRLLTGSGHPLQVPAIDLAEVGAGGGSIIKLDAAGGLVVGPESAGSSPGPVCYGRGGTRPTVTDAAAVLGYLSPAGIAGGAIPIDVAAARGVLTRELAVPLGLCVEEAAYAAIQIANATMLRALRAVSSERGRDPRDYAICLFGGNGPLFGPLLAEQLGARRALVPRHPGIFSAIGLLLADVETEMSETFRADLATLDPARLEALLDQLDAGVTAHLAASGFAAGRQIGERRLSLRYVGQTHALLVSVPPGPLGRAGLDRAAEAFATEHEATYGHRAAGRAAAVEVVAVHVAGRGLFSPARSERHAEERATRSERLAYFGPAFGWRRTPVLSRAAIGDGVTGPAIVEEYDSTCLIPPSATATLADGGVVDIRLAESHPPGETVS